jgi:hypothetical protein
MRMSVVKATLESQALKDYFKGLEAQRSIDVAVIERLNGVIKAIGNLGKGMR